MALPTERRGGRRREDRMVAGFAALAIVIHILEAGFPSPIPGIKPGLANVINLIVLLRWSWRLSLWVGALRVLVGSLLIGSFLTPGFWLSASGATASLAMMGLCAAWNRHAPAPLSAVGIGLLSAVAHILAQFLTAWFWFVPHAGLWGLLPLLVSTAIVSGGVTGHVAARTLAALGPLASPTDRPDT